MATHMVWISRKKVYRSAGLIEPCTCVCVYVCKGGVGGPGFKHEMACRVQPKQGEWEKGVRGADETLCVYVCEL